jgi:dTMP kinase
MNENSTSRGRFITVEGIEGVGKSTNLSFIAGTLRQAGYSVLETREPGGTPLGEEIRRLLLAPANRLGPLPELLLMFAARAVHLDEVIRPALARGQWVVCDRFSDASFAYQGGGRGVDRATIANLADLVHPGLAPDLTLLLDVPLAVSAQRQAERTSRDRFERESLEFFTRVRAAYLERAAAEPGRIALIDANQPLAAVQNALRSALQAVQ